MAPRADPSANNFVAEMAQLRHRAWRDARSTHDQRLSLDISIAERRPDTHCRGAMPPRRRRHHAPPFLKGLRGGGRGEEGADSRAQPREGGGWDTSTASAHQSSPPPTILMALSLSLSLALCAYFYLYSSRRPGRGPSPAPPGAAECAPAAEARRARNPGRCRPGNDERAGVERVSVPPLRWRRMSRPAAHRQPREQSLAKTTSQRSSTKSAAARPANRTPAGAGGRAPAGEDIGMVAPHFNVGAVARRAAPEKFQRRAWS